MDSAEQAIIREHLRSERIDLRHQHDPFADERSAFHELERLGYNPVWLLRSSLVPASYGDPVEECVLSIRRDGLSIVTCHDGIPAEVLGNPEWAVPYFTDGGTVTFLFASCGPVDVDDCLGFSIESQPLIPSEWKSLRKYLLVPPSSGEWMRAPSTPKSRLLLPPANLRFEAARLMYARGAA